MKLHFITGGTGFIGRYLIGRLLERGATVWVLVRAFEGISGQERARKIFAQYIDKYPNSFRVLQGDILKTNLGLDIKDYAELTRNHVTIWHLAASLSFATRDRELSQQTNCLGTRNVVHFANNIAKHFMHISTAYVCGDSYNFEEGDLDVGQKFRNQYESSKFEAEKFVRKHCRIRFSIIRPSIIMGDAYKGKAEGCTFGYYRFAFMFFIFKQWMVRVLERGGAMAYFLKTFGTQYNQDTKELRVPWLVLVGPRGGVVDMVPIDYVVDSMIATHEQLFSSNTTVHLTHSKPVEFKFLLTSLLEDLGYRGTHYFSVPSCIFISILMFFYYATYPVRIYTKSVFWYVPYFTRPYRFGHKNTDNLELRNPADIDRSFLRKINAYATEVIFSSSDMTKAL